MVLGGRPPGRVGRRRVSYLSPSPSGEGLDVFCRDGVSCRRLLVGHAFVHVEQRFHPPGEDSAAVRYYLLALMPYEASQAVA
jgi:hypothetical protein